MAQDTVHIMVWRAKVGEVWKEAGAHTTMEAAAKAANELQAETGLQTAIITWVNSAFIVKEWGCK